MDVNKGRTCTRSNTYKFQTRSSTWSRSNKPTSKTTSEADEVGNREAITTVDGAVVIVGTGADEEEDVVVVGVEAEEVVAAAAHEE